MSDSPVVLAIMMPFLGFTSGSAASAPGAMLSDVAPEGGSGTAVGVFRFAGDVGFIMGPTVAGITVGLLGFRWALAVPVALTLGLVARTEETLRRPPAHAARPPFAGADRALDEW